jgi:hypothetical protein
LTGFAFGIHWIVCCLVAAELSYVCPRGVSQFIACHSTGFFLTNKTKFFRSPPLSFYTKVVYPHLSSFR